MNKKFELLLGDTIEVFGRKLFRIKAKINFGTVEAGELGGYIEKEENLSENGNAWVSGDAMVYGDAEVSGNAWVYDDAMVYGDAEVSGNAWVYNDAEVSGNARVYNDAEVSGNARVYDDAMVYDDARVSGNARVYDDARVYGDAEVSGNAWVKSQKDYIVFKNTWSSFRWFTYTKSNKMWKVGCFYGTGKELIAKAYKDSEQSGKCYEAYVNLVIALEKLDD